MTGPQTCDEAADLPLPDVLNGYQQLTDRDSMSRAVAALQARGEWNDDRSLDPADYPPLTAAEHLELIALGERLARHYRHLALVHHAVVAGATWEQIAAATGGDAGQARQAYRDWAEGQHRLRSDFPGGTIGLGDEEYTAAIEAAGGPHAAPAPGGAAEDTRRHRATLAAFDEVARILAPFDWEHDDRQLALETIERIVLTGGQP
jgi:hypothetical protein